MLTWECIQKKCAVSKLAFKSPSLAVTNALTIASLAMTGYKR